VGKDPVLHGGFGFLPKDKKELASPAGQKQIQTQIQIQKQKLLIVN
jgi:hypothetical protein